MSTSPLPLTCCVPCYNRRRFYLVPIILTINIYLLTLRLTSFYFVLYIVVIVIQLTYSDAKLTLANLNKHFKISPKIEQKLVDITLLQKEDLITKDIQLMLRYRILNKFNSKIIPYPFLNVQKMICFVRVQPFHLHAIPKERILLT